ncbi:putative disease resistance protein RGA1 isoform X2 [Panicum hallii]|uniref:putative disease resistance protein RGA1 isoform X2 n=1 Tax=Panicum hallii TaxID=206008 RepID=UPI000DF4DA30|nr:putative disease resistance protein RGA1 isoform X2 [Panicum hallii]XP_025822026.1 putative disease resistance protein RGA1 isoform X2 [Panicum hallii]
MLCCFEDDMVDMKETLETIGATMEDAEKRSIKEKEVQLWLKRLKNAALDISDMIDEFQPDSKQTDGNKTGILSCVDIAPKITMANKMKKDA